MRARKSVWLGLIAAGVLSTGSAMAVSSGGYDPEQQGCTKAADNTDRGDQAEPDCRSLMFKVSDKSHTYVSVGIPQTPEGTSANAVVLCLDLGTGKNNCARVDKKGFKPLPATKGTKRDPGELHLYFGADDNLDNGEHDSSSQVDNGPSDGGAIVANVAPMSALAWLKSVTGDNGRQFLLTHPLPVADGGFGFCADGICISAQTQQRVAYQGGSSDPNKHSDVSNYEGKKWDPRSCGGPSDKYKDCGGHQLSYWEHQDGTYYVEPGVQFYEDPDPQGSPIGPYPLPAFYVGTCGFVAGGGPVKAPKSPFTNSAGQLRVATGC
ncbi:MAG: hypothetical protein QOG53_528 [Frankiales bacterium]|jgi:hypothetical protein|nr:hypothetical protein [Frankiales bacterium]